MGQENYGLFPQFGHFVFGWLGEPFLFLGPHITTWMRNELLTETFQSVASWEGAEGVFLTKSLSFIKAHNAILLVVKGKL